MNNMSTKDWALSEFVNNVPYYTDENVVATDLISACTKTKIAELEKVIADQVKSLDDQAKTIERLKKMLCKC
jgi:hypothetical protein